MIDVVKVLVMYYFQYCVTNYYSDVDLSSLLKSIHFIHYFKQGDASTGSVEVIGLDDLSVMTGKVIKSNFICIMLSIKI